MYSIARLAFRKTGAAFECEYIFPLTSMEKIVQGQADPKVLFDDGFVHSHLLSRISKKNSALIFR